MKIILINFLIVIISANLFSQGFSVHKLHKDEFGLREKVESFYPENGVGIIPLQLNKIKQPSVTIYGYLPDWEYTTARNYLDYSLLTHISAFDFVVSSDGSVSNPAYWPWTDVINAAHSNGVKVILTAVCFDRDIIRSVITNQASKQNFFNNVKDKIIAYQLDGVNIDFESLYNADKGVLINSFMQELTTFIHNELPGKEVSFAGPAVNWGNYWDFIGLANACDYIFVMGYAFYGGFSSNSGPTSPLTGGNYNITNTINIQYGSVVQNNPGKIILGVPYYGLHWKTNTDQPHSTVIDYVSSTRFRNDATDVLNYGMLWAGDNQTPWYRYVENSEWHQVWYDNDSSLGLKYDLAELKNLKGVGMWALGYDGSRPELWNELRDRYFTNVPVELLTFNASIVNGIVEIIWETASELNNRGFEIERSVDKINWHLAGFVNGAGTATENRKYIFTDENPFEGISYYRLKQIDFDGSYKVYNFVEVNLARQFHLAQNYPNPFNPVTVISWQMPLQEKVSLKIYDILGNEVRILFNEEKPAGFHKIEFNSEGLPSGIYFYRLSSENYSSTKVMHLLK